MTAVMCVAIMAFALGCDRTWSPIRYRVRTDAPEIARAKGYTSLVQIAEKMAGRVGQHCEHVSPGCANCYSGTMQARCLPVNGTGLPFDRRSRDLVEPFLDEKELLEPLKWRRSQRVFVENQSDLFGEWITDEMIERVLAVARLTPSHTFQVLSKRASRMRAWFAKYAGRNHSVEMVNVGRGDVRSACWIDPLENVWLGVSVEDQQRADERIPDLLATPAAVRFLSVEPLLEDIGELDLTGIDWVIIGGESGRNARPMDVDSARSIIWQCKAAVVPCFVKQLGADPREGVSGNCRDINCTHPDCGYVRLKLKDPKGGDMQEWPADLRVRKFPEVSHA